MNNKLIITKNNGIIYSAFLDKEQQLTELYPESEEKNSLVGNIYIGKVSNIAKGINAVFVDIGIEKDVFLQLEDGDHIQYINDKESKLPPKIGDELLVQIIRDSYGSKAPAATGMISLAGRYSVLTFKKSFVGLSSKITLPSERKRLKRIFTPYINEDYGFIIRTNAENLEEEVLISEITMLIDNYNNIMSTYRYKKLFQILYKALPDYLRIIRDLYKSEISSCEFDDYDIFSKATKYFKDNSDCPINYDFVFVEEGEGSLFKKYNFKSKLEKLLNEKIWLKSGANLVIQPTEALVSIDVNTSKSIGKSNFEDTIFAINIEAAKEIARQLRLRNLSGIIIVDFIDMGSETNKKLLLETLKNEISKDRIKTTLIDMTPLGLVELTRKKTDNTLSEKLKNII